MREDQDKSGYISLKKFTKEAENVNIHLSQEDIQSILVMFGMANSSHVQYEMAIKNIIPVLTKNSDKYASN